MPRQLIRVAGAFRGEPQHRHSSCAHDERVLDAACARQQELDLHCRDICGDVIWGYRFTADALELDFRRGGRLRIATRGGVAVARALGPLEVESRGTASREAHRDRLDPVCTLLFLPPQHKRPVKKAKKKRRKAADKPARIPNQEQYESVWRRHDLPRRLVGKRVLDVRAEPISVRLLIEDMPGSVRLSPLREQRGRWLLWWCEDDVRACPGLEAMTSCHRGRENRSVRSVGVM